MKFWKNGEELKILSLSVNELNSHINDSVCIFESSWCCRGFG